MSDITFVLFGNKHGSKEREGEGGALFFVSFISPEYLKCFNFLFLLHFRLFSACT